MSKKSRLKRLAAKHGVAQQVAALPYRLGKNGLEFLVITSRRTRRLILPKGWTMPGKSNSSAAAIEAHEEAGVKGQVSAEPCGSFEYMKDLGEESIRVNALVYPLKVRKVKAEWKERKQRRRKWMSPDEAARKLDDIPLRGLVLDYAETLQ